MPPCEICYPWRERLKGILNDILTFKYRTTLVGPDDMFNIGAPGLIIALLFPHGAME